MPLPPRFRGLLVAATAWTMVFGAAGVIVISLDQLLHGSSLGNALGLALRVAPQWVIGGALMGTIFGSTVILAERRRDFAALSSGRFACWGLLAGAVASLAISIEGWFAGAFPPGVPLAVWASSAFGWASVWGTIGAVVGVAHFRLARQLAKPIDKSRSSRREPVI